MKRVASLLVTMLLLAVMGLARMPVPCAGDGHGHACTPQTCVCDASCSCKYHCDEVAEPAHDHGCCTMANGMPCHMHDHGPAAVLSHFSLPKHQAPTLLASRLALTTVASTVTQRAGPAVRFPSPLLSRPEPPPRFLG